MPQADQHFSVTDPRRFDGDPYDVARRACEQAKAVARILAECVNSASVMARNAQLERNLYESKGEDAGAKDWEDSPQARSFGRLHKEIKGYERTLASLSAAASYNPRNPPKER